MPGKEKGIHITAGSFEYDRVIAPIMGKYPVEKLVILKAESTDRYPGAKKLTDDFVKKMKKNPIDIETEDVDIYDFDEVFLKTISVLKKYSDKRIYINISSAPKLTLVAMMSAAFFSKQKHNLEIFYIAPEDYLLPKILSKISDLKDSKDEETIDELIQLGKEFRENGTAKGISEFEEIPIFPIQEISETDKEIMSEIEECKGVNSIKELVVQINEYRENSLERSSIQYRLEKLEEKGLLKTRRENRRLKIELSRLGEIYLKGYQ
ncbi:MAG: DUF6293 family protein [Thermoplasmata archaeon]